MWYNSLEIRSSGIECYIVVDKSIFKFVIINLLKVLGVPCLHSFPSSELGFSMNAEKWKMDNNSFCMTGSCITVRCGVKEGFDIFNKHTI